MIWSNFQKIQIDFSTERLVFNHNQGMDGVELNFYASFRYFIPELLRKQLKMIFVIVEVNVFMKRRSVIKVAM